MGCVVFGRVAGATAASYLLENLSSNNAARRIGGIAGHVSGAPISISVGGVNISIGFDGQGVSGMNVA